MIYLKLSVRNAKRSLINYLLYSITIIILIAIMEFSNCIAIMGRLANFQTHSLPLLITIIQIILVGYIDTFMLEQRAKEFASYLLLGMKKKNLTYLFLCEISLIGLFCFLIGTTIGLAVYVFFCFCTPMLERNLSSFLPYKSIAYTFCYFCLAKTCCAFHLKQKIDKLQIRELLYEKNRNQSIIQNNNYKKWAILFIFSFLCLLGLMCGIVILPRDWAVYPTSVVCIPFLLSILSFYQWLFGYLYAQRRIKSIFIYQKNWLYHTAVLTSNIKTSATINAVFCMCILFAAFSFITGRLMLQPEFQLFEKGTQQWMGIMQICLCIIFTVIYFSILSLQIIIELKRASKNNQILHSIGKSNKQLAILNKQQIVIQLTLPMLMAFLVFLFCMPLLNGTINLILPDTMHNSLFKFAGEFFLCILFFYICYFFIVNVISRQYRNFS